MVNLLKFVYYIFMYMSFVSLDLAQAFLSLGKTQHRMCLLPESFESLSQALKISETYFSKDYPQVRTNILTYIRTYMCMYVYISTDLL